MTRTVEICLVLVYLACVAGIMFHEYQRESANQRRCEAVHLPRFEREARSGRWQAWCSKGELVVRRIEEPKR